MGHGTTNYLRECGHFANRVTEKNGVIQRWMQLDIWSARNLKFFEGTQTTKIGIWLKKQRDFVENKQRWKLTEIQKKAMFKTRLQKPMRTLNSNCKSKRGSSKNGDLIRHWTPGNTRCWCSVSFSASLGWMVLLLIPKNKFRVFGQ